MMVIAEPGTPWWRNLLAASTASSGVLNTRKTVSAIRLLRYLPVSCYDRAGGICRLFIYRMRREPFFVFPDGHDREELCEERVKQYEISERARGNRQLHPGRAVRPPA